MAADTSHRLEGLEPDNLLAFLALLGLLRTLEQAEPAWRPRVHWDGPPLRPVLTLATPQTQDGIAAAAARGCEELVAVYEFGATSDLTFDQTQARQWQEQASAAPELSARAALLAALFSDGAVKDDGQIMTPPLCAMFGQGHQHFLTRLAEVPQGVLPRALAKRKVPPNLNAPARLAEALFQPWSRSDETDSFRWDPAEDRRYALRYRNPSSDAGTTTHGANRLAALGLPALPGAAVTRPRGLRFLTLGSDVDRQGTIHLSWPIWRHPASLAGITALMAHQALVAEPPDHALLARLGVSEVRRTRRTTVGKYFNFTRAEVV